MGSDTIINSKRLRLALAEPVIVGEKRLFEHPIVVLGSWFKNGDKFSITPADLRRMVENFEKRRNEQVVVDYEHASEMPEIARGGPIPAAGWIHKLMANGQLRALIEWTPQAEELIRSGQYRFFSPAIDWGTRDKETGEPQGATLTSGALTNHPFLEELPAIQLSDCDLFDEKQLSIRPGSLGTKGEKSVKKIKMRKGSAKGMRKVFDDADVELGEFSLDELDLDGAELDELLSRRGAGASSALMDDEAISVLLRDTGLVVGESGSPIAQVKEYLGLAARALATKAAEERRRLLLSQGVRGGALLVDKIREFAREQKISLEDYVVAQEIDRKLSEAVRAGKVLPRDREFFFEVGLANPEKLDAWLKSAPKVINLTTMGIGGPVEGGITVDQEVQARVKEAMKEDPKLNVSQAMAKVLASDHDLASRYHSGHRKEMGDSA